jgi:hypothetical protein
MDRREVSYPIKVALADYINASSDNPLYFLDYFKGSV